MSPPGREDAVASRCNKITRFSYWKPLIGRKRTVDLLVGLKRVSRAAHQQNDSSVPVKADEDKPLNSQHNYTWRRDSERASHNRRFSWLRLRAWRRLGRYFPCASDDHLRQAVMYTL